MYLFRAVLKRDPTDPLLDTITVQNGKALIARLPIARPLLVMLRQRTSLLLPIVPMKKVLNHLSHR